MNKSGDWITKTLSYRSQFIDSKGFMASSLSNLVNNLAEEIIRGTMIKNKELMELNMNIVTAFLNTQILKMI